MCEGRVMASPLQPAVLPQRENTVSGGTRRVMASCPHPWCCGDVCSWVIQRGYWGQLFWAPVLGDTIGDLAVSPGDRHHSRHGACCVEAEQAEGDTAESCWPSHPHQRAFFLIMQCRLCFPWSGAHQLVSQFSPFTDLASELEP